MWFITLIFRNLFRRTTRTVLTVTAAAVAIGTVVALVGTVRKFGDDFAKIYYSRGIDLVVMRGGGGSGGIESLLPQSVEKEIEKIPHVKAVTPGLLTMISFQEKQLYMVPLSGRIPGSVMLTNITIVPTNPPGRELAPGDTHCVLLGNVLASQLGKKVGDTISIYEEEFKVIGIFESSSPLENGAAVILFSELQRLMRREGKVTGFLVAVDNPDPATDPGATKEKYIDQVSKAIESLKLDEEGEPLRLRAVHALDEVLNAPQMMLANALVLLISILALILGSVGMINTMLMSVFERTKEIGILRALGWRKSRILMMILTESWFICLSGAVFGVIGAYVVVWALGYLPTIRNISTGMPGFVWLQSVAVAVLMGFVGGIYPAVRASLLPPTEAVRHE